jgi:hypothetical protein
MSKNGNAKSEFSHTDVASEDGIQCDPNILKTQIEHLGHSARTCDQMLRTRRFHDLQKELI